jgi:integrase
MPNVKTRRRITVEKYLNQVWLPAAARTVKESTLSGYKAHVRDYLAPHLGSIRLHRLTAARLNTFYSELSRRNSVAMHRPLSKATLRRLHATFHRALNDAVKWGYLDKNPASSCDPPRITPGSSEMRTWANKEVARFLEFTADHPLHAVWVLLVTTGMRRGEVLGLRWCDLDLERGTAAVRQTVTMVGREIRVSPPKSRRSRRVVALDPMSVRTLIDQHAKASDPKPEDLVFSSDDRPLNPPKVSKIFTALVEESGLPRIRLHDLRHTHATLALQAGIHPKIVSERLGHATVALTLDVYSHAVANMQEEAARRIGDLIFNGQLGARRVGGVERSTTLFEP